VAKADKRKHREFLAAAKKGALPRQPKPQRPARKPAPIGYRSDAVPLVQRRQSVEV
jgi:hypothetical protein